MKKLLFLLFLPMLAYSQPQLCQVTGTFYKYDGSKADSIEVNVMRVLDSSGVLIYSGPIKYRTGGAKSGTNQGVVTFNILRNSVAYIYARAIGWDTYGINGKPISIPNAASADLASLVVADSVPASTIIAVPLLSVFDSTGNTWYAPYALRFGANMRAIPSIFGDDTLTIISTAAGGADTAGTTNRPEMTNIETDISALSDTAGVFRTKLDLVEQKADTARATVLAANVLTDKRQDDTLTAHKTAIDTKQNTLSAAQIARIDSSLAAGYAISITSQGTIQIIAVDTTGFFAAWGGVMTESDPTAIKADTASLAAVGDQIYPRSSGGVPEDSLNWTKAGGLIRPKPGVARVEVPRLVVGATEDLRYGANINKHIITDSIVYTGGGVFEKTGAVGVTFLAASAGTGFRTVANMSGANELRVGAGFRGFVASVGLTTVHPVWPGASNGVFVFQAGSDRAVAIHQDSVNVFAPSVFLRTLTSRDTIRSGNYTTYSYFIPGGALVSSSTIEVKRNISEIPVPSGVFAKFLSVKPRRYQWKPEAFRSVTFASTSDTLKDVDRWALVTADSLKAEKQAQRWQIGLIAEEFNRNIFGRQSKEIDQAEVTTALWIVLQETIKDAALLKARVDTLETQMAAGQAAIQNLTNRVKALEAK